jgi:hypothetical protein
MVFKKKKKTVQLTFYKVCKNMAFLLSIFNTEQKQYTYLYVTKCWKRIERIMTPSPDMAPTFPSSFVS